jgi:hypothetical protein
MTSQHYSATTTTKHHKATHCDTHKKRSAGRSNASELTKPTATRRYSKTVTRPRKCAHCADLYQPTAKHQKFCTAKCRQAAHRRRHATPKTPRRAELVAATCEFCGIGMLVPSRRQKYCSASCKQRAYAWRRASAVYAAAVVFDVPPDHVANSIDHADAAYSGIRRLRGLLANAGAVYDGSARRWLLPIAAGV